ncbi:MAG: sigma 54-interacting transcriptional regulator [Desulfomonile tiedjei]|uniref:Sigma 54-interacting transcriptional regulator n=1 Tax=Desulfomonile tiedjei TaxID=2358 RepID=A0A9D6V317_9BACT|nr:sigma 54-interacting transcriptional regulator [Desulfomonile tiedjei]
MPSNGSAETTRRVDWGVCTNAGETKHCSKLELLNLILDNIYNGVMVTDADGYVTHFNTPYGKYLGVDPDAQLGKHCTEVIENTRMHIVAKTGKAEINQSHSIRGQNMVVQRIPIKKDGRVIAVFGQVMFKDVLDVGKLAKKLSLLESKVELYEKELISLRSTKYTIDSIVGVSNELTLLKKEALIAAATNLPVLVTGESGTGKELFAQAIHHASSRRLYPFVRINCAAIPRDLLESELFGYEQGAFTGAMAKGKPGKFELAQGGTVFLDEIGDLPLEMQPKLLRVLEEKEVERVGGTSLIRVNFRLIAASNQPLEQMLVDGRFRKDLFYRLNVIPLHIPPLRERRDDIVALARSILGQIALEATRPEIRMDPEAERALKNYEWPGNVRELVNVLEGIASFMEGNVIRLRDLVFHLYKIRRRLKDSDHLTLKNAQHRAEEDAIRYALAATRNNKAQAADLLGIHRTLLYKKMKKFKIPIN